PPSCATTFKAFGADRKNPLPTLEAFQRAFPADDRAMLVIKVNNPMAGPALHPIVRQLRGQCAEDSRLRLVEEPLFYRDILTLYASCDAFVSLHRAEGLGLGLMEAMALGKPVIGTAWSGNMIFMSGSNSCPVGYRLLAGKTSLDVYSKRLLGRRALGGGPDVDDTPDWMRRLVTEPSLRLSIGLRAAESMTAWEAEASRGAFLDELRSIYEQLSSMPSFRARRARLREVERQLFRRDRRRRPLEHVQLLL